MTQRIRFFDDGWLLGELLGASRDLRSLQRRLVVVTTAVVDLGHGLIKLGVGKVAFLPEELVRLVRETLLVEHVAQVLDVREDLLHLLARLRATTRGTRPGPALRGQAAADLAA